MRVGEDSSTEKFHLFGKLFKTKVMLPDLKLIETRRMDKLRNTPLPTPGQAFDEMYPCKVTKVSTEYAHFEGGWVWVGGFEDEGGGGGEPYSPALKPQKIL